MISWTPGVGDHSLSCPHCVSQWSAAGQGWGKGGRFLEDLVGATGEVMLWIFLTRNLITPMLIFGGSLINRVHCQIGHFFYESLVWDFV